MWRVLNDFSIFEFNFLQSTMFQNKICFSLVFMFNMLTINFAFSQTLVPYYAAVSNQCSQTNITTNLTEYEALGLKRRGTVQLQNTFDWLKNKYISYGYSAAQIQEYSYTYSGSTAICKNLEVTKIGTLYPTTFIIVCGHYDSIGGTGTNDNGSGLVSILEAARLLKNIPSEYSIKFINFSGEEDGLKGSQNYVSTVVNATNPKMNIKLVFNLDEVGGVAGLINNTITCERDTSTPTTNNAASNTFTNELITCVGLYSPLNSFLSYAYASDYMSFQSNNEVITGFFEKNETTHKHTATDFLINMDPIYNYNVAKAAIGAVLHFSAASTTLNNQNFEIENEIILFKNTYETNLCLSIGALSVADYTFVLYDWSGKIIMNQKVTNPKQIETFDTKGISKGIYFGLIEINGKKVGKKIAIY